MNKATTIDQELKQYLENIEKGQAENTAENLYNLRNRYGFDIKTSYSDAHECLKQIYDIQVQSDEILNPMKKAKKLRSEIDSIARKCVMDFLKENNIKESIDLDSSLFIIAYQPDDDVHSEYEVDGIIIEDGKLSLKNFHDEDGEYLIGLEFVQASSLVFLLQALEETFK